MSISSSFITTLSMIRKISEQIDPISNSKGRNHHSGWIEVKKPYKVRWALSMQCAGKRSWTYQNIPAVYIKFKAHRPMCPSLSIIVSKMTIINCIAGLCRNQCKSPSHANCLFKRSWPCLIRITTQRGRRISISLNSWLALQRTSSPRTYFSGITSISAIALISYKLSRFPSFASFLG